MQVYWTDAASSQFATMLIYGLAGAGKTPLAATLPDPIIITSEPGLKSLQRLHLPYILGRTHKEATEALSWIKSSSEARKYQSVFFDSISALSENNLIDEKRKSADPRKFSPATTALTMETVQSFLQIPQLCGKHLVMTCKAIANSEAKPGQMPIEPLTVVPKLGPALPYHFDEVFYLGRYRNQQGEEYAALTCRLNELCLARDRSGTLDLWEPANLTQIINKMNGKPNG